MTRNHVTFAHPFHGPVAQSGRAPPLHGCAGVHTKDRRGPRVQIPPGPLISLMFHGLKNTEKKHTSNHNLNLSQRRLHSLTNNRFNITDIGPVAKYEKRITTSFGDRLHTTHVHDAVHSKDPNAIRWMTRLSC